MGDESWVSLDIGTDLTSASAAELRVKVADVIERDRTIELRLQSITTYDTVGLGLLVGLQRRVHAAGGHLVCANPPAQLHAGIRELGLHRVLDIRLDLPERRAETPALVNQRRRNS